MNKSCTKHQCFKKGACPQKRSFGFLNLCLKNKKTCRYCAPRPYGKYDLEDIFMP